ncbi:MAG TPA: YetF domain-containing protein [Rhizomicrobium sp.]
MDALFGIKDHITLWQECARAVLIFAYGLVMLRLSGRRTFARWSALDLIISIIVGSALARAMTGNAPLAGTLAAVALLTLLHIAFSIAVARSERLSDIIEGSAVMLGRGGVVDQEKRKRHYISSEDLTEALRRQGVERIEDTKAIYLEANGKISVIKA